MPVTTADQFLPVELVFNPRWWHQTAGIAFDQAFYLDAPARIRHDVTMRRVLYERYGDIGLGEPDPQPRPVIGSPYVAGGFAIPALLGAAIMGVLRNGLVLLDVRDYWQQVAGGLVIIVAVAFDPTRGDR